MSVGAIYNSLTGLRSAQKQIDLISNNIANSSTEGYTRKTLPVYTSISGGMAAGVVNGLTSRSINEVLQKDLRLQTSASEGLGLRMKYLNQIQDFHGAPDQNVSMSSSLATLQNAFAQLANSPENSYMLNDTYTKAKLAAEKINNFSGKITQMRNDVQTEMTASINTVNALTNQIADLNNGIKKASALDRSTADLEDQRDLAIKKLSQEIGVSYFKRSDNVITVMTSQGETLVDTQARVLKFSAQAIGPASHYPTNVSGVRIDDAVTGTDLTQANLGGKLGELLNLRDTTLPGYQAQADELAYNMATRFDAEGLRLFSRPDGGLPSGAPGSYVGFANTIMVNPAVANDINLLREGTNPLSTVQTGSSEVLRKIVEFTFGTVAYREGRGNADISAATPLFTLGSLQGEARVIGNKNIASLGSLDSSPFILPGTNDTFSISLGAGAPVDITINAGDTANTLVNTINAAFPGLATLGANGQLIFSDNENITIAAGTLDATGLAELGITPATTVAKNPSFQIGVGNSALQTIEILPTDTSVELLAKLNAIPGLNASLDPNGYLLIQPEEGGDITMVEGLGKPMLAFGITISNVNHPSFRSTGLGGSGLIDGRIQTATDLLDYAQQMVTYQSQDAVETETNYSSEESFRAALDREFTDDSGVNVDEEMAELISIQTAYSASARAISAAQEMLQVLMDTFMR